MKLPFSIVLASVANAALPPGIEDQIWCPPNNCEMYINPYGFVGAASNFDKCYDPATDETTNGVWTGSLTNVTAPDDYIEPAICAASTYSQCDTDDDCSLDITPTCQCYVSSTFHPFDPCEELDPSKCNTDECSGEECDVRLASCSPGNSGRGGTCEINWKPPETDKIPAECSATNQCYTKIRSRAGVPHIGVGLCGCYAASTLEPFDECEGRQHLCPTTKCSGDSCDELEAYCDIAPNDNDLGECMLRPSADAIIFPEHDHYLHLSQ